LQRLTHKKQGLVIYHHLPHRSHTELIRNWYSRLQPAFCGSQIWALRFHHGGSHRVYFIIAQTYEHRAILEMRLRSLFQTSWARRFTPFDCTLLQAPY
jgi:hypothetical protein